MEYVDKEEYLNAGIMLEAQQQLQHEKGIKQYIKWK